MTTSRSKPPGGVYQQMIGAYREPDKAKGKTLMQAVITAIGRLHREIVMSRILSVLTPNISIGIGGSE